MFIPTTCGHAVCTPTEPCAYVAFLADLAAAEAPTLTESWGTLHAIA